VSLADLGEAFLGLGQVDDAIAHLEESLAIRESIGDRHGQAATLRKLGQAHASAGNAGDAHEFLTQAVALYEDLGDHALAAEVRADLRQ
jgi:tetratricopeptide (TPR) repeat protein